MARNMYTVHLVTHVFLEEVLPFFVLVACAIVSLEEAPPFFFFWMCNGFHWRGSTLCLEGMFSSNFWGEAESPNPCSMVWLTLRSEDDGHRLWTGHWWLCTPVSPWSVTHSGLPEWDRPTNPRICSAVMLPIYKEAWTLHWSQGATLTEKALRLQKRTCCRQPDSSIPSSKGVNPQMPKKTLCVLAEEHQQTTAWLLTPPLLYRYHHHYDHCHWCHYRIYTINIIVSACLVLLTEQISEEHAHHAGTRVQQDCRGDPENIAAYLWKVLPSYTWLRMEGNWGLWASNSTQWRRARVCLLSKAKVKHDWAWSLHEWVTIMC